MGLYDTISVGERCGQVKCFCHAEDGMWSYSVGDTVDDDDATYSIAMREGGYVNVHDGILESWTDKPKHARVIDKWGGDFEPEDAESEDHGPLGGERYFYED